MNKIIPILLCAVLLSTGVAVFADTASDSGGGTIALGTNAPVLDSFAWFVPGKGWNTSIEPNTEFHVYVNVSDQDTLDNIASISMEFYFNAVGTDNAYYDYKLLYTETVSDDGAIAGNFTQTLPGNGTYIVTNATLSQLPVGNENSQGVFSYIFALKTDNLAKKGSWKISATVTDADAMTDSRAVGAVAPINAYLTMNGNNLSAGLNWPVGETIDRFYTNVTSNAGYSLAANFTGTFNWTDDPSYGFVPTLSIRMSTDPNPATVLTNVLQTWYSPTDDIYVGHNLTHKVTISGVPTDLPGGTYTGITVYMVITNP